MAAPGPETPGLAKPVQRPLRRLMREWFEFERRLAVVPIVRRLDLGTFTRDDYRSLFLNLRPQVVEGSRWISRCASSFDREHADIRSVILRHAVDEHRDYEILEGDFTACGGDLATLRAQPKNPGSEALHAYLMHRASEPNPIATVPIQPKPVLRLIDLSFGASLLLRLVERQSKTPESPDSCGSSADKSMGIRDSGCQNHQVRPGGKS